MKTFRTNRPGFIPLSSAIFLVFVQLSASTAFAQPSPGDTTTLPGVLLEPETWAELIWPPRASIDDEGAIPAPEGMAVISAAPIQPDADTVAGWVAVVIHALDPVPETFQEGLGQIPVLYIYRYLPSSGLADIGSMMVESDPDETTEEEILRVFRFRVLGDELAELCYPQVYRDWDLDEEYVAVHRECLNLLNLTAPTPSPLDSLWVSAMGNNCLYSGYLTMRDVNGDGLSEYLCVWNRLVGSGRYPAPTCVEGLHRGHQLYLVLAPDESGSDWHPVATDGQPLLQTLRDLVARIDTDEPPALEELSFAFALAPVLYFLSSHVGEPPAETQSLMSRVYSEVAIRMARDASPLAAWRCLTHHSMDGVTLDSAMPSFDPVPVHELDWAVAGEIFHRERGTVRWHDEETVDIVVGSVGRRCTPSGCLDFERSETSRYPTYAPDSGPRFLHLVARQSAVTFVVNVDRAAEPGRTYSGPGMELEPCRFAPIPYPFENDPADEAEGSDRWITVAGLPTDGFLNPDWMEACYTDQALTGGLGFIGWLDESRLLYFARAKPYAVNVETRTVEELSVASIPDALAPYAGLTPDRQYRFALVSEGGRVSVWRFHIPSGSARLVAAVPPPLEDTAAPPIYAGLGFFIDVRFDVNSPGSSVLPSPDGTRFIVVLNGKVHGAFALVPE